MLANKAIDNINKNYNSMLYFQSRFTTGKKYQSPSEDPVSASTSLYLSSRASRIQQYIDRINDAGNITTDTETALTDINKSIQSIQELVSSASNATMSMSERQSICNEIDQHREQILYALNYSSTTGYIFGGYNTDRPPVEDSAAGVTYNGENLLAMTDLMFEDMSSEIISFNISNGVKMGITMTALDITGRGDGNLINTIDKLTAELRKDPPSVSVLTAESKALEEHLNHVLAKLSEVGGKQQRLERIGAQLKDAEVLIEDKISLAEDADAEESIIKYAMAEQAYQASLSISGKIVQMSLLDYID